MPSRNPVSRLLNSLRHHPRLAFATGGTALAAVLAGGGLALALSGARPVADAPSPTPTVLAATQLASPTATATSTLAASPEPSATPSAAPTSTPSAAATPVATASPTPEPTPEPVVDRNWLALPRMPDADDFYLRDAIVLEDGRVVAFRHPNDRGERISVLTIEAGDSAWTPIELDAAVPDDVIYRWAQAGDGLVYSHAFVIDPTDERWHVEPFQPPFEGEAAGPVGAAEDGRLYVAGPLFAYLAVLDPETGSWTQTSANTVVRYPESILVGAEQVYVMEIESYAAYDPATDAWAELGRHPYVHAARAGLGPDGRIYVLDSGDFGPRTLNAIDPDTDAWEEVPRPIDVPDSWTEWNPIFLTGPDGRLWAVDGDQSYVFIGDD